MMGEGNVTDRRTYDEWIKGHRKLEKQIEADGNVVVRVEKDTKRETQKQS